MVHPGADLSVIKFHFEGARGIQIKDGDLSIGVGDSELRCRKPLVFQQNDGKRQVVNADYVVTEDRVHFRVGHYNRVKDLVVDPVFDYGTYLGGSGSEWGYAIATDKSGNAYVTGHTSSADFPIASLQSNFAGGLGDVFITKISPDSASVIYSTYIGGEGTEGDTQGYVGGITVDAAGNAYVTGVARSPDFPSTAGKLSTSVRDARQLRQRSNGRTVW